jgi:phosphoglycolate phosphatase
VQPVPGPVVGFDLDLTLVDSAPGIARTMRAALAAEHAGDWPPGEPSDEVMRPHIGIPLEASVRLLAPDADIDRVVAAYRRLYPELGVPGTVLLPGVAESFAAVRAAGGRVLVVSAKTHAAVHAVLAHVGLGPGPLEPDLVAGDLFAGQKGRRLLREGAHAYVGDHPGDMEAARVARATAVAVLTGGAGEEDLRTAGADVVLPGLEAFPAWLASWWRDGSGAATAGPGLDDQTRERHGEADRAQQRQRGEHTGGRALAGPQRQGHAERDQPGEEDHRAGGDEAAGAAVGR